MKSLALATLKRFPILPRGGKLPDEAWGTRHHMILMILWGHAIAMPIYAFVMGMPVWHALAEGLPVAVLTWVAQQKSVPHKIRTSVATLGLVLASAILVHISGGLIEMHFHFFVVVGIVTLYQSWTPFLLAIAFVVVHHGAMGTLMPEEIYNHADAMAHPWRWAMVHGAFILAMSAAGLAAWKFAEDAQLRAVESERKHFEEERRRLIEREEASKQLQDRDQQLRQAQKMEAIGHLAGGIAHDFNNLLGVVVNYGRFVAEELTEDDPKREDVLEIIKAGERGAKLTRQLLTFSRKEVAHPEVMDLNEVVADMFNILSRTITENIDLSTDLAESLDNIRMDRGHIEQVLMNLVVNARDAIATGSGEIIITTTNAEIPPDAPAVVGVPEGNWVVLTVTDTGSGMDLETQRHVFEPFFTTKPVGEGTGLGLATVYGIMEQANAHIGIGSEPGKGTTVTMYFPTTDLPLHFAPVPREQGPMQAVDERAATVMVVEDEDASRKVVVRILMRAGYKVMPYASPNDAFNDCRARPDLFDVLVTDVVMPEMSGKTLSDATALPTVFMSGYTRDILEGAGPENGDPLLQKPFGEAELLGAVNDVLSRTSASVH
jgi:signal transduction histidine kinase/CheY-like chemotaxis protein